MLAFSRIRCVARVLIIVFGISFGMCFLPFIFSFVNLPPKINAVSIIRVPHQMPLQGYCLVAPSGVSFRSLLSPLAPSCPFAPSLRSLLLPLVCPLRV